MSQTIAIRPWQDEALKVFSSSNQNDFLCVATPGAGKTTFALVAARQVLASRVDINKVVVVVPSAHLKEQWANAGARLGLLLETDPLQSNVFSHGFVTTYQSVASNPKKHREMSQNAFIVFDEIHHAGDEKSWGSALLEAFTPSPLRLSLSGTPFRSDTNAIPFVKYSSDELIVDFEYSYDSALKDGNVVRPVHFRRLDGHMEWIDTDGQFNSFSFNETIDAARNQQRLRSALEPSGNWIKSAVARAHSHLQFVRRSHSRAGGLVICSDKDHARKIAKLLTNLGSKPTVVLSDDKLASKKIESFSNGDDEWIVAVRMVSEGVDIPRLCVGLYATSTTTELFFRQAVGRIIRNSGDAIEALMFIPNDPRIVAHANNMAQSRVHSLRRSDENIEQDELNNVFQNPNSASTLIEDTDQLSMFEVLSATPIYREDEILSNSKSSLRSESISNIVKIELPPLPTSKNPEIPQSYEDIISMKNLRNKLRSKNADLVQILVGLSGLTHAQVNLELNKQSSISRISSATNKQLSLRKQNAEKWISQFRKKQVS